MSKNKDKERHIAFNTHLVFLFVCFLAFVVAGTVCAIEKQIVPTVIFTVFSLLPVFVFCVSPLLFVFSDNGVEIVYNFGQREMIEWREIRSIYVLGSWVSKGGGSPNYIIVYPVAERRPFFVKGEISKTRKTTKLIKKYYKKKIS